MLLAGKRLDDTQVQEFYNALHEAFDLGSFEQMFKINLGKRLEDIVVLRDIGFSTVVRKVIERAENESWTAQLLQAALSERHEDAQLRAFAQQFGPVMRMPPLVDLQRAIELQRAVRPEVPTYDFDDLIQRLYKLAGQVCSIEDIGGKQFGTGFLVKPNIIMTNYHVWEAIQDPANVRCYFDHRTTTKRVPYPLAEECEIDLSRYNPEEDEPNGEGVIPSSDELDYALLRLADSPGDKPIGLVNQQDAPKRGWMTPYMKEYPFSLETPLFILHHPQKSDGTSEALQVSLETTSVIGKNENGTRVKYKTNTERGSSGAPCFTADWKLVALHHAGDPNRRPEYNQGIPFKAILDHLQQGDHKDFFSRDLSLAENSAKNTDGLGDTRSDSYLHNQEIHSIEISKTSKGLSCYVIRSETDRKPGYSLRRAVHEAIPLLRGERPKSIVIDPEYVYATEIVSSNKEYEKAIEKLCQAEIAIFDITEYEPAVMLLLGIRSVVRRGITIASFGGTFVIGDPIDIPFNIKELSITSHSQRQSDRQLHGHQEEGPAYILEKKIREGLDQLRKLPQYLDMPAFDAIRNLPPESRAPDVDKVLVLCPYTEKYQEANWTHLRSKIKYEIHSKTPQEKLPDSEVWRVLDFMSPRLVSHAIYQAIRQVSLCIVDWAEWRPNVFFELGVRLAITDPEGSCTVCIIEEGYKVLVKKINECIKEFKEEPDNANDLIHKLARVDKVSKELPLVRDRYILMAQQCEYLLDRFDPLEYNLSSEFESVCHDMMYYYRREKNLSNPPPKRSGCAPALTYKTIEKAIDPDGEMIAVPVYLELFNIAELFSVDSSEGRAAVLYPGQASLEKRVKEGVTQRLLAAWYFITSWYKDEQILEDPQLYEISQKIAFKLVELLKDMASNPDDEFNTGKVDVSGLREKVDYTMLSHQRQKEGNNHE